MPIKIQAKGNADTTIMDCKPFKAFSPPAHNNEAAVAPNKTPQVMVTLAVGSGLPRCVMELITIAAESAEVIKKHTIDTMANITVSPPKGRFLRILNSMASAEPESLSASPLKSMDMAAPPKTINQLAHTVAGTMITTVTNSRKVRPREILAINMPTKGVREIHQAQRSEERRVGKA